MQTIEQEIELEPIDDMAYYQLSLTERFQLACAVIWPWMAFGVCLGATPLTSWIDLALVSFLILVLGPWMVRVVVGLHFFNFHLAVIRHGSLEYSRNMNYRESLSVSWLVTWRPLLLAAFWAVTCVKVDPAGDWLHGQALGMAVMVAAGFIFQASWLNQVMTEKIYVNFCLVIRRAGADSKEGLPAHHNVVTRVL